MEEVFPRLSQLPEQLRDHLQKMIDLLEKANLQGPLQTMIDYPHISQVFDTDGNLRCLFKAFCDDDEHLARKEACVYILDHPEDDHRSRSQQVYGFSGVPPSVFLRFKMGNQMKMGVLVEYVESKGNVEDNESVGILLDDNESVRIPLDEIHKIVVADLRFGNMDRNGGNLLVREVENETGSVQFQLVPIDHELSFSNDAQAYNICSPYWMSWLWNNEEAFSVRSVNYVARLDPNDDIGFLRHCGWEPGVKYIENFKVFAIFLKKAVSQGLTARSIGLMASYKCEKTKYNLQDMVDSVTRDDNFLVNVETHIEKCVREYHEST